MEAQGQGKSGLATPDATEELRAGPGTRVHGLLIVFGAGLAVAVMIWPGWILYFAPLGLVLVVVAASFGQSQRNRLLANQERYRRLYEEALREATARRVAEEQQAATLRELENVTETIPDILYQIDTEARLVRWNQNLVDVTGWSEDELKGKPATEFFDEADQARVIQAIASAFQTGRAEVEAALLRQGRSSLPYQFAGSPLRAADGSLIGLTGIGRDITERKAADEALARQAAELRRSNADLESFAYIASHDLKEPLRGLHNYAAFLHEDYAEKLDDEGRRKLQALMRLTQRMDALIDALLQYSRIGRATLAVGPVDLTEVVSEALDSLSPRLEECGTKVRVPEPLPTIVCDRARVTDVYLNLISNAMKYNDKEERWIEIGWHRPAEEAGRPVLVVRDNGIGVREKHLERIFQIFRRLHGRDRYGGGTGAGLSIVKRIVESHGGRIWAESVYGEGTTMLFELGPMVPPDAVAPAPSAAGGAQPADPD